MIFIDTSFYISLVFNQDSNHQIAKTLLRKHGHQRQITSQAVIAEFLTVGSMRFNKHKAIIFINELLQSDVEIFLEETLVIDLTWEIFKQVTSKNVSWIDCYSLALVDQHRIPTIFTFDQHFPKLISQFKIKTAIAKP